MTYSEPEEILNNKIEDMEHLKESNSSSNNSRTDGEVIKKRNLNTLQAIETKAKEATKVAMTTNRIATSSNSSIIRKEAMSCLDRELQREITVDLKLGNPQ